LFNDLDGSMDSREDDFEKKADDPNFLGFHRIEKGLFTDKSTAGLTPIADKLMADALDLAETHRRAHHCAEGCCRRSG
jgi:iron uptake system component EfeO